MPPLPELKVTLVEAPGTVKLEHAFHATCRVTNTRYPHTQMEGGRGGRGGGREGGKEGRTDGRTDRRTDGGREGGRDGIAQHSGPLLMLKN